MKKIKGFIAWLFLIPITVFLSLVLNDLLNEDAEIKISVWQRIKLYLKRDFKMLVN